MLNRKRKPLENTSPAKKFKSKHAKSKAETKSILDSTDSSEEERVDRDFKEGNVEMRNTDERSKLLSDRDNLLKVICECMSDPGDILDDDSFKNDSGSSTDVDKDKKRKDVEKVT